MSFISTRTGIQLNNNKMNGNSNIPLRKSLNVSKISNNNSDLLKWQQKYEDTEIKRKSILIEKEKCMRKCKELEKKNVDLQIKHEQLETELFEKNEEFTKLTTASKNLYKEYEMLKNQYDTETGAMTRALKDASQWYKENKVLKRKTMLLNDKDTVDEGVDAGEGAHDADIDNLNRTIKQLSSEVAELQTEVDGLKHIEFQTTEQNIKLTEELELEREKNARLNIELNELKKENEQFMRITEMLRKELEDLQESEENQRNNVLILRKEAGDYKKERNVLAHQSTLLLQGLNSDNGQDCMVLLQEIENLKRTMEDEHNRYEEEITVLQEKVEEQEKCSQLEVLEERLNLVENELQLALSRAEKAEEELRLKNAPPLPPPPPPPPLPPTLPPPTEPPVVPLRVKRRSRINVLELAETIGVNDNGNAIDTKKSGVNEDIINAIKEGKFTLKKAKNDAKKERETSSKAVSEILNILGNLKRAPKKRPSQVEL